MHDSERVSKSGMLSTVVNKITKAQLANSPQTLENWSFYYRSLMWANFDETVNRIAEKLGSNVFQSRTSM